MENFRKNIAYRVSLYLLLTVWTIFLSYLFIRPMVVVLDVDYYVTLDNVWTVPFMYLSVAVSSFAFWFMVFIVILLRVFSTSVNKGWWDVVLSFFMYPVIWIHGYVGGTLKSEIVSTVVVVLLLPFLITVYLLFKDIKNKNLEEMSASSTTSNVTPLIISIILVLIILVLPVTIVTKDRMQKVEDRKNGIYR